MKLLCDENLPGSIAPALREAGIDAVDIRELGLTGADDDRVLALACEEGRVLVTMDLRRFANLVATPPASTPGLVVARMPSLSSKSVTKRLVSFLLDASEERIIGALTILEPNSSRRRT
ncbi:MAG: DUF5615 family PIN-like protein [Pseudomonadota bacterium]